MAQKKKKQHYVPQFYLNAWSIPDSHQTHVYDRISDTRRISNIEDVAMENGFYNIIPMEVLPRDVISRFREQGLELDFESQGVENAFAEDIETAFSKMLGEIIENARNATPFYINNCYFLNAEQKGILSVYLSFQYLRTKSVRKGILELSDKMNQALDSMGAPPAMPGERTISKKQAKNLHVKMLLDEGLLTQLTMGLHRLTWILGINRTDSLLYTTDNPIAVYPHKKRGSMYLGGIVSEGIEAFFPLTPKLVLMMIDGSFHTQYASQDRRYMEITNRAFIERYNKTLALQAERAVFSINGEFDLLQKMKEENPNVFNQPQIQLRKATEVFNTIVN